MGKQKAKMKSAVTTIIILSVGLFSTLTGLLLSPNPPDIRVRSQQTVEGETAGEVYEVYFSCGSVGGEIWWCAIDQNNSNSAKVSFATTSLAETREMCATIYPSLEVASQLNCNMRTERKLTGNK